MKGAKKIAALKQDTVKDFQRLVKEYPIIGIVNMENLPAKQLQNMREQLRDSVELRMTKKNLIKIILSKAKEQKPGVEKLAEYMTGMPAMIFTRANPFVLFKKLDDNKSSAPAKAGQKASGDIIIPAGPTPFSPGPVIGELGALRIKSGVENGKVVVKEAATVVKEGQEIKASVASLLTRLGIEPMEIGLDLVAVYENGEIYTKSVLAIDEEEYLGNVRCAAAQSVALALHVGYISADTIKLLLQKARKEAVAVGKSQGIPADELVGDLLATAEAQMLGLKGQLGV
jgi:large subunit ribosomal protein L10